jgi:GTP-binding protein EngB required for normal cell division
MSKRREEIGAIQISNVGKSSESNHLVNAQHAALKMQLLRLFLTSKDYTKII